MLYFKIEVHIYREANQYVNLSANKDYSSSINSCKKKGEFSETLDNFSVVFTLPMWPNKILPPQI